MARQILRIRDLGQSTFWQLMQMEGQPAPLTGKTALLLAADGADTQDVLAATAAARQLGMDVDMLPPALWAQDMASCDLQASLYAHAGLCLTAGLKGGALDGLAAGLPGAVVNAGNDKGAPGQALADLALLAARHGDWESLRISWLGGAQCGLACDLITAILSKCHTGDFFGEPYAACSGAVLNISVVADEDCEIIFLNVQRLLVTCQTACEHHQKLIRNLVSVLANKILILNDKITHVGKRTTRDKLLSYLSAESIRHSSLSFDIPFDRQQLADYLCIDRAAMSTEISKLQKEGFIKTNRNHFELTVSDDTDLRIKT